MASQSARLISAAPIRSQAGCAAGPPGNWPVSDPGPLCAHFSANYRETINRNPGSVASAVVRAEAQSCACRRENGHRPAGAGDLGGWRITGRRQRRAVRHRSRVLRAVLAGTAGIALIAFVAAIQPEQQPPKATGVRLTAEQAPSPAEGRGPVAIDVDDDNTDANNQMQNLLNQASTLLSGSSVISSDTGTSSGTGTSSDNDDQSQELLDEASQQQQENEQQDELNQQQSDQTEDEVNQAVQQDDQDEQQDLMQLDEQDAGQ
jgi:hypothetical protein